MPLTNWSPGGLPSLKYVDISEELRRRIEAGQYAPGQQLPPQVRLAQEFGVALLTLRQGLQLLESQGYLYRRSGSGTFVKLRSESQKVALVVDDDEAVRTVLAAHLTALGWEPVGAQSGSEALAVMATRDVAIVFLDLVMPVMDGAETFAKVREINPDVPVVVVTGYPDSDLVERALRVGSFTLLRKPFSAADIQRLGGPDAGIGSSPIGRAVVTGSPVAEGRSRQNP